MPEPDQATPARPDQGDDEPPAPVDPAPVDPDAPGRGVDDDRSDDVPEPNEPA